MNNFGFENLCIVGKIPEKEDFYLAAHSEDILANAQIFPTLKDALQSMDMVILFTRRFGKTKKSDFSSDELGGYLQKSSANLKTALVFGRETYGLTDAEAELCPLRCYIPTGEHFQSLNLAQSVAIILYEIFKNGQHKSKKENQASLQQIEETSAYIMTVLHNINYFRRSDYINLKKFFDNLLVRSNSTISMNYRLKQIFNRINVLFKGTGERFKM